MVLKPLFCSNITCDAMSLLKIAAENYLFKGKYSLMWIYNSLSEGQVEINLPLNCLELRIAGRAIESLIQQQAFTLSVQRLPFALLKVTPVFSSSTNSATNGFRYSLQSGLFKESHKLVIALCASSSTLMVTHLQ